MTHKSSTYYTLLTIAIVLLVIGIILAIIFTAYTLSGDTTNSDSTEISLILIVVTITIIIISIILFAMTRKVDNSDEIDISSLNVNYE